MYSVEFHAEMKERKPHSLMPPIANVHLSEGFLTTRKLEKRIYILQKKEIHLEKILSLEYYEFESMHIEDILKRSTTYQED
jgi:hypothetical protein